MNCGYYTHRTGFKLTKVIFSLKQDFCTLYSIRIVGRSSYIDTDVADQSAELLITMWFLSRWYDIISSDIRYNLVRVIWEIQTTRFIIVICIYTGMKMSVDMTIHELNHSVTVHIHISWMVNRRIEASRCDKAHKEISQLLIFIRKYHRHTACSNMSFQLFKCRWLCLCPIRGNK